MRKRALVTGSSGGIGRAIALRLAAEGWDVGVNCSRSTDKAEAVAEEIRALGARAVVLQADVGDRAQRDRMFEGFFEAFGGIDLLVNNAGVTKTRPMLEMTEEILDSIYAVDFRGAYFCTQAAARRMIADGTKGVIVNISSIHQEVVFPETSGYGSMKAALSKFTRHAAVELAPYGVRVAGVAPGWIDVTEPGTPLSPRAEYIVGKIPMQRQGSVDDIVEAVMYLAGDGAGFVTGQTLMVDGGMSLPAQADNLYAPRVVTHTIV